MKNALPAPATGIRRARRPRWIETYVATIGATDGNIIAAIIETQVTMKNTGAPGPIDMAMPDVRRAVTHQARAAVTTRTPYTSSRQPRNGSSRHRYRGLAVPAVVTGSGGPGELGREPGLTRELGVQPEGLEAGAGGLADGQRRARRMEDVRQHGRVARRAAEGHHVVDLQGPDVAEVGAVVAVGTLEPHRHPEH